MSNIQTGAERMPHDLSHLGFLAGQIGRLITISTTPVIAGDSFEMDAVGALRLSPLRRSEERFTGMPRPISYAVFCLKKKKTPAKTCNPTPQSVHVRVRNTPESTETYRRCYPP